MATLTTVTTTTLIALSTVLLRYSSITNIETSILKDQVVAALNVQHNKFPEEAEDILALMQQHPETLLLYPVSPLF